MRWPSLETNHLRVSQIEYAACAIWAPAWCIASVTATIRSPFSDSGTDSGSSRQPLLHDATLGPSPPASASDRAGPATRPLARAVSAARRPASAAAALVRVGVAKNPHDEPTSARTPSPAVSSWASRSTTPFCADIDSVLENITRASA